MTATLEKKLDATHVGLLRAAFGVHYSHAISNKALYVEAGLHALARADTCLLTMMPWPAACRPVLLYLNEMK